MEWKRFPVPSYDYRALKNLTYVPPTAISGDEAARIVAAAGAGDRSVAGGYPVEPDPALLESLNVRDAGLSMVLCALPGPDAHLLGRSFAWFNQRVFVLDRNAADAETLHNWRTPRPMNALIGPEAGVSLDRSAVFILSGRILSDHTRGNRVMIDQDLPAGEGREGFRVIAACDEGDDNFHDSVFELTWQS